jgi:hypothetical chaperone protein
MRSFGLAFGTTNTAVAAIGHAQGEAVQLARFDDPAGEGTVSTFRSLLYFDPDIVDRRGRSEPLAGPHAIKQYLAGSGDGRLIQSLKSYLASRLFTKTTIHGGNYNLEALIALILSAVRRDAEKTLGPLGGRVVVGRPVRFVGAETPEDEQLALTRLTTALEGAGFDEVTFEYEPVAAAYHYASQLDHDELVLVADFGGGTSDFCLCRVGPSQQAAPMGREQILGTGGVGLAGDTFDGDLVWHVVAPALGLGSTYRAPFGTQAIEVPNWIYGKLRKWHHISFLKSRDTMEFLANMRNQSLDPKKIEALIKVVDFDLGYALYRAIEASKVALSSQPQVGFAFDDPDVPIHRPVTREEFVRFIGDGLQAIGSCVDRLLEQSGVSRSQVDRVFMTGGTSLVPAVRALFAERFGADRLRSGDEFTSVALGLAMRARDLAQG